MMIMIAIITTDTPKRKNTGLLSYSIREEIAEAHRSSQTDALTEVLNRTGTDNYPALYKAADAELYKVKESGKGNFRIAD